MSPASGAVRSFLVDRTAAMKLVTRKLVILGSAAAIVAVAAADLVLMVKILAA